MVVGVIWHATKVFTGGRNLKGEGRGARIRGGEGGDRPERGAGETKSDERKKGP